MHTCFSLCILNVAHPMYSRDVDKMPEIIFIVSIYLFKTCLIDKLFAEAVAVHQQTYVARIDVCACIRKLYHLFLGNSDCDWAYISFSRSCLSRL